MCGTSQDDAVRQALARVSAREDCWRWANAQNMYIAQAELLASMDAEQPYHVIVDTRDEDVAGGMIIGALHVPDASFGIEAVRTILRSIQALSTENVLLVFHCMESARRGPRCARRFGLALQALQETVGEEAIVAGLRIAVLQGGFDQWIRKYWKDPSRVQGYDDAYWGYDEATQDRSDKEEDEEVPREPAAPQGHKLYERPADQPATPWSAAGAAIVGQSLADSTAVAASPT